MERNISMVIEAIRCCVVVRLVMNSECLSMFCKLISLVASNYAVIREILERVQIGEDYLW